MHIYLQVPLSLNGRRFALFILKVGEILWPIMPEIFSAAKKNPKVQGFLAVPHNFVFRPITVLCGAILKTNVFGIVCSTHSISDGNGQFSCTDVHQQNYNTFLMSMIFTFIFTRRRRTQLSSEAKRTVRIHTEGRSVKGIINDLLKPIIFFNIFSRRKIVICENNKYGKTKKVLPCIQAYAIG